MAQLYEDDVGVSADLNNLFDNDDLMFQDFLQENSEEIERNMFKKRAFHPPPAEQPQKRQYVYNDVLSEVRDVISKNKLIGKGKRGEWRWRAKLIWKNGLGNQVSKEARDWMFKNGLNKVLADVHPPMTAEPLGVSIQAESFNECGPTIQDLPSESLSLECNVLGESVQVIPEFLHQTIEQHYSILATPDQFQCTSAVSFPSGCNALTTCGSISTSYLQRSNELSSEEALQFTVKLFSNLSKVYGDSHRVFDHIAQDIQAIKPELVEESDGKLSVRKEFTSLMIDALAKSNQQKISTQAISWRLQGHFCVITSQHNQISVTPQALDLFRSVTEPISAITVLGRTKIGKSALINSLLCHTQPQFPVYSDLARNTKGVLASFRRECGKKLEFLFDCEGLDEPNGTAIMGFMHLVSSVIILSHGRTCSHSELQQLALVNELLPRPAGEKSAIIFLRRDVQPTRRRGDDVLSYLPDYLSCVAQTIRTIPNREYLDMPPLDEQGDDLVDSLQLLNNSIDKFVTHTPGFENGRVFADTMVSAAELINSLAELRERSVLDIFMDAACSRYSEELFSSYKNNMLSGDGIYVDDQLQQQHTKALQAAVSEFNERTKGSTSASVTEYLNKLQERIAAHYDIEICRQGANSHKIARKHTDHLFFLEHESHASEVTEAQRRFAQERAARIVDTRRSAQLISLEQAAKKAAEKAAAAAEEAKLAASAIDDYLNSSSYSHPEVFVGTNFNLNNNNVI